MLLKYKLNKTLKHTCKNCQYCHSNCSHSDFILKTKLDCCIFKLGKCFTCIYSRSDRKKNRLDSNETDEWYKRGCEIEYPSGCSYGHKNKYISNNIITRILYNLGVIK